MDYRKFNIYGQRSLDGIPSAPEPELDSFEVLTRSVSRSLSLGGGHHQHSTPQSGTKRSGSRDPISNLRAAGKVSSGRSSNLANAPPITQVNYINDRPPSDDYSAGVNRQVYIELKWYSL